MKQIEYFMETELDKFYDSYEESNEEKQKLLIDFQSSLDSIQTESNILSKMKINPINKTTKKNKSSINKVEIIDLKKSNKHNLF